MTAQPTSGSQRRTGGGGAAAFGIPEWALPVLAAGETLVPFTRHPGELRDQPQRGRARPRHSHDLEAVHAEGSVLHDAALRPSRDRSWRHSV